MKRNKITRCVAMMICRHDGDGSGAQSNQGRDAEQESDAPTQSVADGFADKGSRQAAWKDACDRKQLSVAERNRAASIFPADVRIRVLAWPKL